MKADILVATFVATLLAPAFAFGQATHIANPAIVSGGHSTSANYTQDSAIDLCASGVATSAAYANRPGFVGQLYTVTGLAITAGPMPATVGERATTHLAAGATLDDASLLVPAASQIAWSVVSGPVTAIATNGTATADSVYQDTPATLRGTYAGASGTLVLTVRNTTSDDFGPYAGDGLDDNWQVANCGPNTPLAAPTADPDHDGQTNLMEFLAGTNPNLATSVFTVCVNKVAGQPTKMAVVFGPVTTGRTYRVLASTDLKAASWVDISGPLTGTSGNLTFSDTAATAARKFYRVQISNP